MSGVNQTQKIMTELEFNKSPLKSVMSYQDYFTRALKSGSAFDFAKMFALGQAQTTSDKIKDSVKYWALEKEAQKVDAEEAYYEALAQYEAMKSGNEAALKKLQYATNMYGEKSTQFYDALKKYNSSDKSLFASNTNLDIARDRFNSANTSAFKAFLTSRLT